MHRKKYYAKVIDVIAEAPKYPGISRLINRYIFRDLDISYRYEIPPELDCPLVQSKETAILLQGKKDDLQITLTTKSGIININSLAPEGTTFEASNYIDMVSTKLDKNKIMIPVGKNYRHILTYGILHGIGRMEINTHKKWAEKSKKAHFLLLKRTSHLQAFGKIELSKDPEERFEEIQAWHIISKEEREVGSNALKYLKILLSREINPFPDIRTIDELTKKIVNSHHLRRTGNQIEINPNWPGKQIGFPMTLSEDEVRTKVGEFYQTNPAK